MKIGVKHQNQQSIVRADFSGGLNTSANVDGIAENQLSVAVNVEVDHATGRLRTVAGTTDVLHLENIFAALYDEINKKLLLVTGDKTVYATDFKKTTPLGKLSGDLYPISTSWEDGILIASGDKLQYFNGKEFLTLDSPNATSVYVRAGRVLIADENNVRYSGVGDETNWAEDTNDDSSSKFVEAGYKDGGKLIGMINLSQDILLIKNNHRLYRLSGEFPKWAISEVSRNIEVSGRMSYCAVADSVFILGKNELQNVQTTSDYGDMKPQNIATLIARDIQNLPANTFLRYVPPLSQLWAIKGQSVLMFDLVTQSWFRREFHSPVIDVIPVGNDVLIIKKDRVSKLNADSFTDLGEPLKWKWYCKRLVSQHDFLLKRVQISFTPYDWRNCEGQITVGKVVVPFPKFQGGSTTAPNSWKKFFLSEGRMIYGDEDLIIKNPQPIYSKPTIFTESRNVFRSKFLDIGGTGSKGGVVFNSVIMDLVEV